MSKFYVGKQENAIEKLKSHITDMINASNTISLNPKDRDMDFVVLQMRIEAGK